MRIEWPGVYIETNVRDDGLWECRVSSYVPSLRRDVGTSFSLTQRELNETQGLFDQRVQASKRQMGEEIAKAKLALDL